MTTQIRIDEIALEGTEANATYAFRPGINVIHGETGSGKTSLLELLKYCLGGRASLSLAVQEGVKTAQIKMRLQNDSYILRRRIGTSTVEVRDASNTVIDVMAVNRRQGMRRIADFLLEASGLPNVRLSSESSGRSEAVSFFDFYAYVYVPQSEIDRSVVGHLDTFRNRKRVTVFEHMFGFTNEEVSRLRNELDEAREGRRSADAELSMIARFLEGLDLPSASELTRRRGEIEEELAEQERLLEELRVEGRRATASSSARQAQLREALERSREATRAAAELEARISARTQFRFELESDRERAVRGGSATQLLGTLDFHQCPRCLQGVEPDRFGTDHCYLCGQSEPHAPATDHEDERQRAKELARIDDLLDEVSALLEHDRDELQSVMARRRSLEAATRELGAELDSVSEEYVSPKFDEIAAIGARIGELRQERDSLSVQQALWERQYGLRERLSSIDALISDLQGELDRAEGKVAAARSRLVDLSDIFDEIVQQMEIPWYTEPARIDPETYLPIVSGMDFQALSSGGMKMMANVAYHLSLLTYALANRDTYVPSLLIIDSPRKNLGATAADQHHSRRFYEWIDALVSAYTQDFQIIIADNDPPTPGVSVANEIAVSHSEPTVPGLSHPGPGVDLIE